MVTVGRLVVRGKAGTNVIALAANLARATALRLGSYRLTATPSTASGATGTPRTATFSIVK